MRRMGLQPRFAFPSGPVALLSLVLAAWLVGCGAPARSGRVRTAVKPRLQHVDLSGAAPAAPSEGPVTLHGARNEWVSFAVDLTDLPPGGDFTLRFRPPRLQGCANLRVQANQLGGHC